MTLIFMQKLVQLINRRGLALNSLNKGASGIAERAGDFVWQIVTLGGRNDGVQISARYRTRRTARIDQLVKQRFSPYNFEQGNMTVFNQILT